jgi:hypothetical protein
MKSLQRRGRSGKLPAKKTYWPFPFERRAPRDEKWKAWHAKQMVAIRYIYFPQTVLPLSVVLTGLIPKIVDDEPPDERALREARYAKYPIKKHQRAFDEFLETAPETASWEQWMDARQARAWAKIWGRR